MGVWNGGKENSSSLWKEHGKTSGEKTKQDFWNKTVMFDRTAQRQNIYTAVRLVVQPQDLNTTQQLR